MQWVNTAATSTEHLTGPVSVPGPALDLQICVIEWAHAVRLLAMIVLVEFLIQLPTVEAVRNGHDSWKLCC